MIARQLHSVIREKWFSGKTILLLGARQVGKTTLLKSLLENTPERIEWINGDNPQDRALLNQMNSDRAHKLFPKGTVVVIDEAQRLENSGLTLKIIHDACPGIQLIATGSSSFELSDKLNESMTGRKWTYKLYPVSVGELQEHIGYFQLEKNLETRLLYGSYPDVINRAGSEKEALLELTSDYLYKDVFALQTLRKPEKLEKLVQALAFQIGNQVSYRELAQITGLDKETVERYIWLLEEAFIVFRLPSFSRNLRNELKKSRKIYFYDLGIRNAVIQKFSPFGLRDDIGQLWENFLIVERYKYLEYSRTFVDRYFWRTKQQQEIDYLEEADGVLHAFEFKWSAKKIKRLPKTFTTTYPEAKVTHITRENYIDFVAPDHL